MEDDPHVAEQPELPRRRGTVEHAHDAALHVRRPAADDPPVRPQRTELRGILGRDDVEVPVEVNGARPVTRPAADDARILELRDRLELDHLGREPEPLHRLVQDRCAPPERPAGRILRVDGDELLDKRGHLVGARLEPLQHRARAIHGCILLVHGRRDQPPGCGKRTCMWFSWFGYGTTTPLGPLSPVE